MSKKGMVLIVAAVIICCTALPVAAYAENPNISMIHTARGYSGEIIVLPEPNNIPIFRLPNYITLQVGESVTWTPYPEGGRWLWDYTFLRTTIHTPGKFTALKAGTTTVTYVTDEDERHTIKVTIKGSSSSSQASVPKTGGVLGVLAPGIVAVATGGSMLATSLSLRKKRKKRK